MKATFFFLFALFFYLTSDAQCYQVAQVTYVHDSINPPDSLMLMDDQYSGPISIGFPFCFYGEPQNFLLIGADGVISFDTSQAHGYCPWPIGSAIPSSSNPLNAIFLPWQDLYPPGGGIISYQTIGVAPNRKFIVDFNAVTIYSCTTTSFTGQVKLYESSNVIEIGVAQKLICSWNGGYAIEGMQNRMGTAADVVPGRNYPSSWTTTNDSWTFTPVCFCVGIGIPETSTSAISLFATGQNQITIIPNGESYKVIGVYDMPGQEVKFAQEGNIISLANAAPGIYLVTLEVNGERVTRKVMMN
jgi:hypothetical protein